MSKYLGALTNVEVLFSSSAWTTHNIAAYPANFTPEIFDNDNEDDNYAFVKVEVLPVSQNLGYNEVGVGGIIIIQIYTPRGKGSRRVMEIADLLDDLLQLKSLTGGNGGTTRTTESALEFLGIDQDDTTFYRADYSVRFKHYIN